MSDFGSCIDAQGLVNGVFAVFSYEVVNLVLQIFMCSKALIHDVAHSCFISLCVFQDTVDSSFKGSVHGVLKLILDGKQLCGCDVVVTRGRSHLPALEVFCQRLQRGRCEYNV